MYKNCLLILTFFSINYVLAQNLLVNTTLGVVRGVTATDGDYAMYLGIPYGRVVDSNPFGTSIPHPEFEGIYDANDDSHICPQREEFNLTLTGDLDCLRLNIFVPSTANVTGKRPVFVWIYGGMFSIGFYGGFMYGPKYLVRHGIIVVTINYRVGPYGFMCLDTPEVPGNQGLKDQILALKWLRENIEAFGGDPDNMTAGGNSAGSMSINLHLLRQNDGPKLLNKAILQSGTSYSLNYNRELNAPILLSKYLGFITDSVSEAISFLATQDPYRVVEASVALELQFRPCVEKEFEGVEAYLLNNPFATSSVPAVKDMPIIIGFNNDESAVTVYSGTNTNTVGAVLAARFDIGHEDFVGMEEVTEKFFYGDEIEGNLQPRIDLGSDTSFIYPSIRSLKKFIESGAEKVYLYEFSYNGDRNFVQHRLNISGAGAWHADEISYLFDMSYMEEPKPEDQLIVDRMTTLWANFVKTGDPTPEISELLPVKWEPVTKGSPRHYLGINTEMAAGTSPNNERMIYWDLFYEANSHLQIALNQVDNL